MTGNITPSQLPVQSPVKSTDILIVDDLTQSDPTQKVRQATVSVLLTYIIANLGTAATQSASTFLQAANNLSDIANTSTARTNLGLGNAAVKGVSDNTKTSVVSASGSFTVGHILKAADTSGTAQDGGVLGTMAAQAANSVAITGGTITSTAYSNKPITESTTARTLGVTDAGATISTTATGGNCTITIPTNSVAIPIGSQFKVVNQQGGSLLTSVSVAGGVTLIGNVPSVGNTGYFIIEKINTNTWLVVTEFESKTIINTYTWGAVTSSATAISIKKINGIVTLMSDSLSLTNGSTQSGAVTGVTALDVRFRPLNIATLDSSLFVDGTLNLSKMFVDTFGALSYQSLDESGFTGTVLQTYSFLITYPTP